MVIVWVEELLFHYAIKLSKIIKVFTVIVKTIRIQSQIHPVPRFRDNIHFPAPHKQKETRRHHLFSALLNLS